MQSPPPPAEDENWQLVYLEPDDRGCILAQFRRANRTVEFVSDYRIERNILYLYGLHADGGAANLFGPAQLRKLGMFVKEALGVTELRIDGAIRTTGASPGRKPCPLVF